MSKFDLSISTIKKNFKVINFCENLDYLVHLKSENYELYREQDEIYKYIIYFSFFKKVSLLNTVLEVSDDEDINEFDADYTTLDKEFLNKKSLKLRSIMFKKLIDSSLLEYLNDNFKLIYHFPIWRYESLILSKFNNRYYHFTYFPDEDIDTGRIEKDVLKSSHKVVNYFDEKISKKEFFDEILSQFREGGGLIKGRDDEFFEDKKNKKINYWHKLSYDNFDEDAWHLQGEKAQKKKPK